MSLRCCVLFTALWFALTWNTVRWCGPRIQKEILIRVQRRATKFILKSDDPYDIILFEEVKPHVIAEGKITDWCDILI